MSAVTIKGFVYLNESFNYMTMAMEPSYHLYTSSGMDVAVFGLEVGPYEFDYEIPADFNPVAVEVAALETKLRAIDDAHMKARAAINDKLSKLQAIGCEVTA